MSSRKKNVLLVGSGGREHALAWKFVQSPLLGKLYVAPGNGGIGKIAERVSIAADDVEQLRRFAVDREIDLVVVGPEAPLLAGVADAMAAEGIKTFGPGAAAARIEGSKSFAKQVMLEAGVPMAAGNTFDDADVALAHLREHEGPIVVKADGLAAGKGVVVAADRDEAERAVRSFMIDRKLGDAGERVVIEECLVGEELSVLAVSDGREFALLVPARDHKPIFEGNRGPNTGGMGAYAPVPRLPEGLLNEVRQKVVGPTLEVLASAGSPFRGILYAGLMLTPNGLKVLEFNARFGDPETQVVVPLLQSDLLEVCLAAAEGNLSGWQPAWYEGAAVTVVAASPGYPGSYPKGLPIQGLDPENGSIVGHEELLCFHGGTTYEDGVWRTDGGRVLAVTGLAGGLEEARKKVYLGLQTLHFEGMHYRRDIAQVAD